MIDHNTQETLLLDLSMLPSGNYKKQLMKKRRARGDAEEAETS